VTAAPKLPAPVGSDAERALEFQLRAVGIPFEREVAFAKPRLWRADFVLATTLCVDPITCPVRRHAPLLVEIDGGTWTGGRHVTGSGVEADCEKLGEATALGYRVLRVTPKMVEDGRALKLIERCLA
jgi:hypothetical protein